MSLAVLLRKLFGRDPDPWDVTLAVSSLDGLVELVSLGTHTPEQTSRGFEKRCRQRGIRPEDLGYENYPSFEGLR